MGVVGVIRWNPGCFGFDPSSGAIARHPIRAGRGGDRGGHCSCEHYSAGCGRRRPGSRHETFGRKSFRPSCAKSPADVAKTSGLSAVSRSVFTSPVLSGRNSTYSETLFTDRYRPPWEPSFSGCPLIVILSPGFTLFTFQP